MVDDMSAGLQESRQLLGDGLELGLRAECSQSNTIWSS